ncbi:MAG: hypothetical protein ABGY96_27420 [bacterium]
MFSATAAAILISFFPVQTMTIKSCPVHQTAVTNLFSTFGESNIFIGYMDSGSTVRVYFDPSDKSWTVTLEDYNGLECMKASGSEGKIIVRPDA